MGKSLSRCLEGERNKESGKIPVAAGCLYVHNYPFKLTATFWGSLFFMEVENEKRGNLHDD